MVALGSHPFLTQAPQGPVGVHYKYNDYARFPHVDEEGICWQPEGFTLDQDTPENEDLWLDYEDSVS